jgi:cytoskeletal protein CcmA (bactofilin family)
MGNRANDQNADLIAAEEPAGGAAGGPKAGSNVDSDVEMEGDLEARSPIRMNGRFKGHLSCGETLSIGSPGFVTGETEAVNVVVGGEMEGDLLARKRLEIQPGGSFFGELVVQPEVLVLAEAAQFARRRPKPESEPSGKVVEMPTRPT